MPLGSRHPFALDRYVTVFALILTAVVRAASAQGYGTSFIEVSQSDSCHAAYYLNTAVRVLFETN